jgi:hypothetical protein
MERFTVSVAYQETENAYPVRATLSYAEFREKMRIVSTSPCLLELAIRVQADAPLTEVRASIHFIQPRAGVRTFLSLVDPSVEMCEVCASNFALQYSVVRLHVWEGSPHHLYVFGFPRIEEIQIQRRDGSLSAFPPPVWPCHHLESLILPSVPEHLDAWTAQLPILRSLSIAAPLVQQSLPRFLEELRCPLLRDTQLPPNLRVLEGIMPPHIVAMHIGMTLEDVLAGGGVQLIRLDDLRDCPHLEHVALSFPGNVTLSDVDVCTLLPNCKSLSIFSGGSATLRGTAGPPPSLRRLVVYARAPLVEWSLPFAPEISVAES